MLCALIAQGGHRIARAAMPRAQRELYMRIDSKTTITLGGYRANELLNEGK